MTPLLAAPLVVLLACTSGAQQQKTPITPLEGVWREQLLPGERETDRFGLSCSGDKISFNLDDQLLQGRFEVSISSITITVLTVNGRALTEKSVYSGSFCLEEGTLYLRILPPSEMPVAGRVKPPKQWEKDPERLRKQVKEWLAQVEAEAVSDRGGKHLGLAPITYQLEKLKK